MTCPYINTLERECGREMTIGGYCDTHFVCVQLDHLPFDMTITVPLSVRPTIDRILSRLETLT